MEKGGDLELLREDLSFDGCACKANLDKLSVASTFLIFLQRVRLAACGLSSSNWVSYAPRVFQVFKLTGYEIVRVTPCIALLPVKSTLLRIAGPLGNLKNTGHCISVHRSRRNCAWLHPQKLLHQMPMFHIFFGKSCFRKPRHAEHVGTSLQYLNITVIL